MNQDDLAEALAKRSGLARSICAAILTEVCSLIEEGLAQDNEVSIKDFGLFIMDGDSIAFAEEVTKGKKSKSKSKSKSKKGSRSMVMEAIKKSQKDLEEAEEATEIAEDASSETVRLPKGGKMAASAAESSSKLTAFAADILGLDLDDVERGLGLAKGAKPAAEGRRVTFPVQINKQQEEYSGRLFKPADDDERRSFKDLVLKNFFLSLGSVVRDKRTQEPLIVYEVEDKPSPDGERYEIWCLRIKERRAERNRKDTVAMRGNPQALVFEEVPFDSEKHDVMIIIDPAVGPRIHGFDVGEFTDNDRRERAEIALAQEFETYRAEQDE